MADHVLQVPLFLMTLMRYITPTLDNLYDGPLPTSTIDDVTDIEQVHGVFEMGRHDLCAETQAR